MILMDLGGLRGGLKIRLSQGTLCGLIWVGFERNINNGLGIQLLVRPDLVDPATPELKNL